MSDNRGSAKMPLGVLYDYVGKYLYHRVRS